MTTPTEAITHPVIVRNLRMLRISTGMTKLTVTIVQNSGLDWTIVRPSILFDLPHRTHYTAGQVEPIGTFTARIDLAHYLTTLASDPTAIHKTVIISTTEHVPTFWQNMRRQSFKPAHG